MIKDSPKKENIKTAPSPGIIASLKEWQLVAFILLVTFLVFSPALKNDFVNWDDDANITNNPNVSGLNAQCIKGMFSSPVTGGYTPLTSLTFALENEVFGMKPAVFHFNNILLHLFCTLLVFVFMRKMGISLFISFVATLLFGIHPMRVESVAWISERKDVLYGSFYLLAAISYLNYYKSKKQVHYFLALAAFIIALLSKIQAVTLPLVLVLIDYFLAKEFRFRQLRDKIPFFILSLATGAAGLYVLIHEGELDPGTVLPLFQRHFIGAHTFCAYILKSVFPYPLSAIYPYPAGLSVVYYGSVPLVLLLAFLIYKSGKYRKELIFGSLFFFFNVMFMLQIIGAGQALRADRFTYLAYIGLFYLVGWAVSFLFKGKWKIWVIIPGVILLSVYGTLSWKRTQVWKNSETLFTDVIRQYPKTLIAYNNLGIYYSDHNQSEKAISAYGKALAINPVGYLLYNNRGEAYFNLGETDKALADMNRALEIKPDYTKALINRGAVRGSQKEFELALTDLDKAISLDDKNLKAYRNRLLVHYSLGNFEKAIPDCTSYLNINPDDADVLNLRGLCYGRLNKNQEALADYNRCIKLNPKAGAYFENRSYLLYQMRDARGALKDILKAQELGVQVDSKYLRMLGGR